MAKKGQVRNELSKIEAFLAEDITPKQRLALLVARNVLKWQDSLGNERLPVLPSPSEQIMKKSVEN